MLNSPHGPPHLSRKSMAQTSCGIRLIPEMPHWMADSATVVIRCLTSCTFTIRGSVILSGTPDSFFESRPMGISLHLLALKLLAASRVQKSTRGGPVVFMTGTNRELMSNTSYLVNTLAHFGVSSTSCVLDPFCENTHPELITPPGTIGFVSSVPNRSQLFALASDSRPVPPVYRVSLGVEDLQQVESVPLCELPEDAPFINTLHRLANPLRTQLDLFRCDTSMDVELDVDDEDGVTEEPLSLSGEDTTTYRTVEPTWPSGPRSDQTIVNSSHGPIFIIVPPVLWDNLTTLGHSDCDRCHAKCVQFLLSLSGELEPSLIYFSVPDQILMESICNSLDDELSVQWETLINEGRRPMLGGWLGGRDVSDEPIIPILMKDLSSLPPTLYRSPRFVCASYRAQWLGYFYGYGPSATLREVAMTMTRGKPLGGEASRALIDNEVSQCVQSVVSNVYSFSHHLHPMSLWLPAMSGCVTMNPKNNQKLQILWRATGEEGKDQMMEELTANEAVVRDLILSHTNDVIALSVDADEGGLGMPLTSIELDPGSEDIHLSSFINALGFIRSPPSQEMVEDDPCLLAIDGVVHVRSLAMPYEVVNQLPEGILNELKMVGMGSAEAQIYLMDKVMNPANDDFIIEVLVTGPGDIITHMKTTKCAIRMPKVPKAPLRWVPGIEVQMMSDLTYTGI
eukprot:GHVH01008259.1.p1 GENE.GHVH01008259.1~~GHVH01008259.1.p1  ORF type:complete len:722 (+),score=99.49 GHVH01008259.1:125-2167(+)